MIPHSRPSIGPEEAAAAQKVIMSGFVSQGSEVEALERELARFLGVKGAAAVSSGTAGLHLALLALGVKGDSRVHIPSYVCNALLNAVNYCGAEPSVCDVDPVSGNIDVTDLKRRISSAADTVILPHMFGTPAPADKIKELEIRVVEDCAQSIGARIGSKLTGTIGEISVFSFYATKVLCAGEGGAVASDSGELLAWMRDLRDYDHKAQYYPRFNYKMTEIQAAIARVQLGKLPDFIKRRQFIAERYNRAVDETGFRRVHRPEGDIYFRYLIFCDEIPEVINCFRDEGVTAACPVFNPIHRYLGLEGFLGTEEIHRTAVSIPCYPDLNDEEVENVCRALKKIGSSL